MFSFQGTVLWINSRFQTLMLKIWNPASIREIKWWAKVDSNHRPHDYQSCALTSWAIGPLVEMSGIEPLTPCLQGRCSPSWATPPYEQGIRIEIFSFPRLKVHNLSIAPSKLNNDLRLCSLWLTIGYETLFKSQVSLERRWSSRTFRYGYLVTTSP